MCIFLFLYRIDFIQGMERGVQRTVEAEEGRERQWRSRVEADHEHVEREGRRDEGAEQEQEGQSKRAFMWLLMLLK